MKTWINSPCRVSPGNPPTEIKMETNSATVLLHTIASTTPAMPAADLFRELIRRGVTLRAGRDEQSPGCRVLDLWPADRARDLREEIDARFGELHELAERSA
jgi:hypothetical protein